MFLVSLCNLCALRVSVMNKPSQPLTTETRRAQRLHREIERKPHRLISSARIVDRARELLLANQIARECAAPLQLPIRLPRASRKHDVAARATLATSESLPASRRARRSRQFFRCYSAPEPIAQAPSLLSHRPRRDAPAFPLPGNQRKQSWHSRQAILAKRDEVRDHQSSFPKHDNHARTAFLV